jgi:hypothetical protein
METVKANGITWTRFKNASEFYTEAISKGGYIATAQYYDNWAGKDAVTWEAAQKLALVGWNSGRSAITALSDKLNITSRIARQEIVFDVTGEAGFDVGRMFSGEPECMMDWRDSEELAENPGKQSIHIIVNVTFSGGINESIIRARGAAIMALIEALDMSGKIVSVDCIFAEGHKGGQGVYIPIKKAGDMLQRDLICFAVAHPSFSRRFGHAITKTGISPGTPAGIQKECDIYIPEAFITAEQWKSEASCLKWITEKLAEYGVTLNAR